MAVNVVHEPEGLGPHCESCCRCRAPTRYWYEPLDVALCRTCAAGVDAADLPTKDEWVASARRRGQGEGG